MKSLRSRLPPVKSLVAFEAVARHLSLTKAGQELFISREAVSRQIRILEEHLGLKLFDRLHRSVGLTQAGDEFYLVIQNSLENIAQVSSDVRKQLQPKKITISATVAISSFWLTPLLIKYRQLYPNIEISVMVSDAPVEMVAEGVDLAFRYGHGQWPGLQSTSLFEVSSFPVCSPAYLEKSAPIKTPNDLLSHNLVNLNGELHQHENWLWWLKGHGVVTPENFQTMGFDNYNNVIQVALQGQGIALGFSGLVGELLADKKLVQPLGASLKPNGSVFMSSPSGVSLSQQAQYFSDWLLTQSSNVENLSSIYMPPSLL